MDEFPAHAVHGPGRNHGNQPTRTLILPSPRARPATKVYAVNRRQNDHITEFHPFARAPARHPSARQWYLARAGNAGAQATGRTATNAVEEQRLSGGKT